MGTQIRRSVRFCAAILFAAGLAACGSDATSPTSTTPTGTSANGTTITVDSAVDAQTATVGGTIHVFVRVKNSSGSPVAGDTVTWNVASGGGSVPSKTSVTDANGIAATDWTLGTIAGPNSLGANITGAAVPITATGVVGSFALLAKQSADSQSVTATGSVLLTVRATDLNGNAIANVVVTWSATGGIVSPVTAITGSSGNASVNFTTPASSATYIVFANAAGVSGVSGVSYIVKAF